MPKFRKKPAEVDAERWEGPRHQVRGVYCNGNTDDWQNYFVYAAGRRPTRIHVGDWVILEAEQDALGTVLAYPCEPDVFEATYEPAE